MCSAPDHLQPRCSGKPSFIYIRLAPVGLVKLIGLKMLDLLWVGWILSGSR